MPNLSLSVRIDPNSGFCFGVIYAIQMAEDLLDEQGYLYCLGDIVHNDEEVQRLEARGLRIICHEQSWPPCATRPCSSGPTASPRPPTRWPWKTT